jgi:dienelactone hydrolase
VSIKIIKLFKMNIRFFFSILFSIIILQSCGSGTDKTKTETTAAKDSIVPKEKFPTGQVIEKVLCQSDPSQSYSMYLPSNYTSDKTFPIIYVFDAHGTGKLPISKYKNLAEKYDFIIVGSNNSKNGNSWEQSQSIANVLFADVQTRLSINTARIYVLGFSGGARIANAIAISNGAIAGVICCGAAAPAASLNDPRSGYTFLGIAGNRDFNYIEMRKYDMIDLAGRPIKHAFIEFDGKHEWPSEEVMNEAFLWTEFNSMRIKTSPKNDSFVKENFDSYMTKIKTVQQKNDPYATYNLVKKTITFFDGLADLTECYKIYKPLKENTTVDKRLKEEESTWKQEGILKQYYTNAFQTQNLEWWKNEISSLNKKIKAGGNSQEALMYIRTLDYLSLAAYMQSNGALSQNNFAAAKIFCPIYVLVDPTNSEAHYLNANLFAIEQNPKEAIKSLNEAVKNGFVDTNRLQSDSTFSKMNMTDEFKDVCKKINDANAKANEGN